MDKGNCTWCSCLCIWRRYGGTSPRNHQLQQQHPACSPPKIVNQERSKRRKATLLSSALFQDRVVGRWSHQERTTYWSSTDKVCCIQRYTTQQPVQYLPGFWTPLYSLQTESQMPALCWGTQHTPPYLPYLPDNWKALLPHYTQMCRLPRSTQSQLPHLPESP